MADWTHLDNTGRPSMVDVGGKPVTRRVAVAEGLVTVSQELAAAIRDDTLAKGNLLRTAELAGIQAAKRTDELIPLCHGLPLDAINVRVELLENDTALRITAEAVTSWKTGVEMEAMAAVSVAALTIVDMGKAIDRSITIRSIRLVSKTGGRSGDYTAPQEPAT